MNIQLVAVAGGPILKWLLNYLIPKVPERLRPLVAPVSSILIWGVSGLALDMGVKDMLVNALLTSGGAVMTHEAIKDTIKGGK